MSVTFWLYTYFMFQCGSLWRLKLLTSLPCPQCDVNDIFTFCYLSTVLTPKDHRPDSTSMHMHTLKLDKIGIKNFLNKYFCCLVLQLDYEIKVTSGHVMAHSLTGLDSTNSSSELKRIKAHCSVALSSSQLCEYRIVLQRFSSMSLALWSTVLADFKQFKAHLYCCEFCTSQESLFELGSEYLLEDASSSCSVLYLYISWHTFKLLSVTTYNF